ncbi:ClpP/crotonase-like domain-containing protein [Aspergillus aurantiobrunneus]
MPRAPSKESQHHEFRNWFAEPFKYTEESPAPSLNTETRAILIERIINTIKSLYLDPSLGASLVEHFQHHISNGAYDHIVDGSTLAKAITSDLQFFSGDKHFRCFFGIPPDEPSKEEQHSRLNNLNCGFGDVKFLPENIATLEIRGFVPVHWEDARERIDEVISSVVNADALVLDLRSNRGGDPKTVALVASYLLDEPTVWLRMAKPSDGSVQAFLTEEIVTEKRFATDKPVFVITIPETISGGEDLAYGLQSFRRATVVGERTAGAANLPRACVLSELFVLFVPYMQPAHPVTGSNWEETGVIPDTDVLATDALDKAHGLARAALGHPPPLTGDTYLWSS